MRTCAHSTQSCHITVHPVALVVLLLAVSPLDRQFAFVQFGRAQARTLHGTVARAELARPAMLRVLRRQVLAIGKRAVHLIKDDSQADFE